MSLRLLGFGLLAASLMLVAEGIVQADHRLPPGFCNTVAEMCNADDQCCEGLVCDVGQGGEGTCTPCRGEGMLCTGAGAGNCCESHDPRRDLECISMTQDLSMCYVRGTVTCNGEGWQSNAGGRPCCGGLQSMPNPGGGGQICTSNQPAFQAPAYVKVIEPLWPAAEALRNQPCNENNPWCIPILPGWLTFTFYFVRAFLWILNVAIGFVVIWILISGFLYMTSGNNQSQRSDAVTRIQWSIAGLLLLLFASVIMRTLNSVFFT